MADWLPRDQQVFALFSPHRRFSVKVKNNQNGG